MDEDGPRVARAGRRAGRKVDTWGEPETGGEQAGAAFERRAPPASEDGEEGGHGAADSQGGDAAGTPYQQQQQGPPERPRAGFSESAGGAEGADGGKAFVGISRRKQEQLGREDEEAVRKNKRYEEVSGRGEDILDIPELEEEGKEDLSNVVASAPKVRTNRVQGMSELDEDMHYKLPSTEDHDIDLTLLTAVLCASEQVQESQDVWEPELLLTEIASAVNEEHDPPSTSAPEDFHAEHADR